MAKRRAIGWAVAVVFAFGIIFGLVWAVLYWGGMLPFENEITGQYGFTIFDTNTLTFMETTALFWPVAVTFFLLLWLWQKSNKRDEYV